MYYLLYIASGQKYFAGHSCGVSKQIDCTESQKDWDQWFSIASHSQYLNSPKMFWSVLYPTSTVMVVRTYRSMSFYHQESLSVIYFVWYKIHLVYASSIYNNNRIIPSKIAYWWLLRHFKAFNYVPQHCFATLWTSWSYWVWTLFFRRSYNLSMWFMVENIFLQRVHCFLEMKLESIPIFEGNRKSLL